MVDLGTAVGGLIAGLVGLIVTLYDRHLEKQHTARNWHRRVYRLSIRLQPVSTDAFSKISEPDRSRLISRYGSVSERLEDEITKVPPKSNLELLSACENAVMYCDRMKIHQDNTARLIRYHSNVLEYAEEIQYLAENGFPESYPTDMMEEEKEDVKGRMEEKRDETTE